MLASLYNPAAQTVAMLGFRPESSMPIIETGNLKVVERLPGWKGRYFHSQNMTFAHYEFVSGASIHEHYHPQEEVYEVIEGELEITIDGKAQIARPGVVAIVPGGAKHFDQSTERRTGNHCGPSAETRVRVIRERDDWK